MATRTQTPQTVVRPQQPAPVLAPAERPRSGERGYNRCSFIGRLGNGPEMKVRRAAR